jgi:histone H3/H4
MVDRLDFVPPVKKLLKTQKSTTRVRPPTLSVLASCAASFMDLLVEAAAQKCVDEGRNQLTSQYVLAAITNLHFTAMLDPVRAKHEQVQKAVADRKRKWGEKPTGLVMTGPEQVALMERLRREAVEEVRKRRLSRQGSQSDNAPS